MSTTRSTVSFETLDHPEKQAVVFQPNVPFLNFAVADEMKASLKKAVAERLDAGRTRVVVDLSGVTVMDSSGLSVLIAVKQVVDGRAAEMTLAAPTPIVRLFVVTKLDRVFRIVPDVDEALA